MRHSQGQALLKAAILALITILLLDLASALTAIVFQFHSHGSPEKSLSDKQKMWSGNSYRSALNCSYTT